MTATADAALIKETLERLGEAAGDMTPQVYQAFFAMRPKAQELFAGDYDLRSAVCDRTGRGRLDSFGAWPRGMMLGGSSSVNGTLYVRGQPQDYDNWAALGAEGRGWKEIG